MTTAPTTNNKRLEPDKYSLYKGDIGMWAWVLHRISGVTIFFFLFIHVLDTAIIRLNPDDYNKVIDLYKNPIVSFMEIGIVAAVVFHALNGVRVILVDLWNKGPRYQKQMLFAVGLVFVLIMIVMASLIISHIFNNL